MYQNKKTTSKTGSATVRPLFSSLQGTANPKYKLTSTYRGMSNSQTKNASTGYAPGTYRPSSKYVRPK
jgi:hypothetical protein